MTLPLQPTLDAVVASDEALQSYYQDNLSDFKSEEQVILDYIELSADVLVLDDPVSEADILARFTEESDGAVASTSRRAAHILLDADNEGVVDEILASIAAGESFADLAARYSTDAGSAGIGGDLGFSDGSVFPESFETALTALEVGAVSGRVVTDSGIHLIKLLEIDKTTFELESESARIASQLQRERADALVLEKLAQANCKDVARLCQTTRICRDDSVWKALCEALGWGGDLFQVEVGQPLPYKARFVRRCTWKLIEVGQRSEDFSEAGSYFESGAFSPDGKTIVSGSGDKTIKVWGFENNNSSLRLLFTTPGVFASFRDDCALVTVVDRKIKLFG